MYHFKSTTSIVALLILTAGFSPFPGLAADITVPANTTSSGQKSFGGTDKVVVGAGGVLTSTGDPTLNETTAPTTVFIDNFGTIESTGTGARAIRFNVGTAMSFTVTNEKGAIIQSQNDAINVGQNVQNVIPPFGLTAPNPTPNSIAVNNYGTIQATGVNNNNGQAC